MRKLVLSVVFVSIATAQPSFTDVQSVLKTYCVACHQGARAAGRLDLTRFRTPESIVQAEDTWGRVLARVRASEMPPKGARGPAMDEREKFISWVDATLRQTACGAGL